MLTPQEVQDKRFAKAVFGGYDMAEVDDFLDQLGGDYEALLKETVVLKSKLKTLAEKVEEYRAVDEDMRKTLVATKRARDEQVEAARRDREAVVATAEAEAENIVAVAQRKADDMIIAARIGAENQLAQLKTEIADDQSRLQRLQSEMKSYATASAEMCRRQLELLQRILEGTAPQPIAEKPRPIVDIPAPADPQPQPEPTHDPEVQAEEVVAAMAGADIPDAAQGDPTNTERIIGRHVETVQPDVSAQPVPLNTPRQFDVNGVTINVTTLDLDGDPPDGMDDSDDGDEVFRDIFK